MQITVLVENEAADQHSALVAEWGLSVHIKHQEMQILFDTGAKSALVRNWHALLWTSTKPG